MLISRLFHSHITFRKKEFWKATGLVFSEGFLEAEPVWILFVGWGIISSMYIVGARTKLFFRGTEKTKRKQKDNKYRTKGLKRICVLTLYQGVLIFSPLKDTKSD